MAKKVVIEKATPPQASRRKMQRNTRRSTIAVLEMVDNRGQTLLLRQEHGVWPCTEISPTEGINIKVQVITLPVKVIVNGPRVGMTWQLVNEAVVPT